MTTELFYPKRARLIDDGCDWTALIIWCMNAGARARSKSAYVLPPIPEKVINIAFKNPPMTSLMDGLGMGIGFTLAITLLSAVREVLGSGTFLGLQVMPASYHPMAIIIRPPGGFVMLGILLLLVNALTKAVEKRKQAKAKEEIA